MALTDVDTLDPNLSIVPVGRLAHGMFVSALDRPWLETPFLLQGFLLEDDDQIGELKRLCREVVVDHTRSTGRWFSKAALVAEFKAQDEAAQDDSFSVPFEEIDLVDVFHQAALARAGQRKGLPLPAVNAAGESRFDEELIYSASLVDDVLSAFRQIRESNLEDPAAFRAIADVLGEMADAASRNPDALLWLTRLKATDEYSYDHALDVSVHLMIFARHLGMAPKEIEAMGLAGLMQDVGKADVPADILHKPGPLDAEEFRQVQAHVANSLERLMGKSQFSQAVIEVVANHHERIDGSGYPRSLTEASLPIACEAAGLVDTYCAMTRKRVYGDAQSCQHALETLIRMRGTSFREVLVDQFLQCLGIYPVGSVVELNTGEVAVVIQQNRIRRLMPRVLILLGPDKTPERHPRAMDLILRPRTPLGDPYRIVFALPGNAYGIDPTELFQ